MSHGHTVNYGLRRPAKGEVEHLGNISVGDIREIYYRLLGDRSVSTFITHEVALHNFWASNSGEIVEWTGDYWRGRIGKFGALIVRVKKHLIDAASS